MIYPDLVASSETVTETIKLSNCFIELIIGIALALVGFLVIRYLVKLMLKENEALNGKVETVNIAESLDIVTESVETTNETFESQALEVVDNEVQTTQNNGENSFSLKTEEEFITNLDEVNEENNSENQTLEENTGEEILAKASETNKNEMSLGTVIMFTLSGVYMLFMWLMTLISGF
jgi:hypothetical protein